MRISDWSSDVCSSDRFNAEATVPAIVVIGMVRELAPVLAGLMVAGRVSSAMAAELGTMRVTEQLDAMVTLRTDPYRYLVAPRVLASTIALPLLVLEIGRASCRERECQYV